MAFIVLAITGYKIGDKTVTEHAKEFLSKSDTKEGIKDIRQMVGEAIKAVGEEISDDVNDKERQELDKLVRDELKKLKEPSEPQKETPVTNKNKEKEGYTGF
ncbi:MAG: hypothetical protein ABIE74_06870 [Pseudomonadota bacterium]